MLGSHQKRGVPGALDIKFNASQMYMCDHLLQRRGGKADSLPSHKTVAKIKVCMGKCPLSYDSHYS